MIDLSNSENHGLEGGFIPARKQDYLFHRSLFFPKNIRWTDPCSIYVASELSGNVLKMVKKT